MIIVESRDTLIDEEVFNEIEQRKDDMMVVEPTVEEDTTLYIEPVDREPKDPTKIIDLMIDATFITTRKEAKDYYEDYEQTIQEIDTFRPSGYVPTQDLTKVTEDVEVDLRKVYDTFMSGFKVPTGKQAKAGGAAGMAQTFEEENGYLMPGMAAPLWGEYEEAVLDESGDIIINDKDEVMTTTKSGGATQTVEKATDVVNDAKKTINTINVTIERVEDITGGDYRGVIIAGIGLMLIFALIGQISFTKVL